MQNIKPLLASASPLGVIQNFDISNRFLLRKSNFQLGLTNYIEPLGTRLLGKSPLVKPLAEYSNLLPSQEQPVIDEGWNFQAFTFPVNELEGDISLGQEEETKFSDNDFIENHTTTIITDLLPNTTQTNFDNRLENNQDSILSTNSATNITSVKKSHTQQSKPSEKTNFQSKDKSKTKSRTKKSSTDKSQKQPKKRLASNLPSETHQILSNDNELLLNFPSREDPLEANNLLSEIKNNENTNVAVKEIVNEQPIKNSNTNTISHEIQESDNIVQADFLGNTQSESHLIDLGTFVNQSVDNLSNYQENFTKIEQLNNQENLANTKFIPEAIAEPILPKTPNLIAEGLNQQENLVNTQFIPETIVQRTPNLIVEDFNQQENLANTKFIPEATTEPIVLKTPNLIVKGLNQQENLVNTKFIPEATPEPIVPKTPNLVVEGLNQQENLVNTQLIAEVITEPIVQKTPNLTVEGLNQPENLANTEFIPEVIAEPIVQKTPNLIVEDTGKNPKIYSDEQIISFADSTKLASNNISEITINNTFGKQNPNLEPTNAEIDLSPIIQTVIKDDITENQPPVIQENTQVNNLEIVNDTIYPVLKPDSIIAKPTQDDLQVNYPVQSASNYPQATTDLINNQQIEATKILSNQEISTDAEISDTAVNLRLSQPDKNVNNAKLNLQVNNISSNFTDQINTSKLNDNTAIKIINLESNVNSINQEQILAEVIIPDISGIVNKFPETQNIETITDSTEVSPKNFFDNLPQHLQELPAPTGYAIGGLVAPSNAVNAPIASSDTIPAMLTPGEFVINTRDAQKNINVLRHINSGGILPEDITTANTPNIEPVEETNTDFLQPSTLVDNFQTSPDIISPKLTNPSISSQQNSEIRSSVITTDNPLQFNVFTSTKNSTDLTENQRNYSSPPLIFREVNNNTTKNNNLNTSAPSQWNTVEELLNGSADESTIFNYSNDNTESINYNSNSNLNYTNLQTPQISTKRLPVIQGFADGREVTKSDIATDIQPIAETIKIAADFHNFDKEEKNENDSPDLETLAREIYARLRQRLEIERERYGMYSGRLPW